MTKRGSFDFGERLPEGSAVRRKSRLRWYSFNDMRTSGHDHAAERDLPRFFGALRFFPPRDVSLRLFSRTETRSITFAGRFRIFTFGSALSPCSILSSIKSF